MTGFPEKPFPARPFFSCNEHEFLIVDQSDMGALLTNGVVEPWLRFAVGPDNALDSPPLKVLEHTGSSVRLRCRDAVVELDLDDEIVRKTLPDGSTFAYLGGLREANEARGWIPAG